MIMLKTRFQGENYDLLKSQLFEILQNYFTSTNLNQYKLVSIAFAKEIQMDGQIDRQIDRERERERKRKRESGGGRDIRREFKKG